MLSSTKEVHNLLDRIENHYLANSDEAFRFALLTDFSDANAAEKANDKELLDQAIQGIRRLNQRYGQDIRSPFICFIADVSGMQMKAFGWGGNASVAS